MSDIINKVKEAIIPSSTKNDSTTTDSTAHDSSYGPGGASAQRSNFASGADSTTHDPTHTRHSALGTDTRDQFGNNKHLGSGTQHTAGGGLTSGSTNAGPHDSNVANKLDPRVDSDRDGKKDLSTGSSGPLSGTHHAGGLGSTTHGTTHGSDTAGPHKSDMANKLDPRVDSDRDGSNKHTAGGMGGLGSTTHGTTHGTSTAGPHKSDMANKLDPRVDSDRDGSNKHTAGGMGGLGSTTHGTTHDTSTAGPHKSDMANKLDPRVDSDRDGSNKHTAGGMGGLGSTTHGTTHDTSTAGPHKSDMANKLDPRVDSDRDASNRYTAGSIDSMVDGRTVHGDQTNPIAPHTLSGMKGMGGTTANPNYGGSGIPGDTHTSTHGNVPGYTSTNAGGVGTAGHNTHGTTHGLGSNTTSTTAGPHNSDTANKLDPRVDSDRDGHGIGAGHNTTTTTTHHGPSGLNKGQHGSSSMRTHPGPHKIDLLNKLDPRVDSEGNMKK